MKKVALTVIVTLVVETFLGVLFLLWRSRQTITHIAKPTAVTDDLPGKIVLKVYGQDRFLAFDLAAWKCEPFLEGQGNKLDIQRDVSPDGEKKLQESPFDTRREVTFIHEGISLTLPHHVLVPWDTDWSPDSRFLVYATNPEDTPGLTQIYLLDLETGGNALLLEGRVERPRWIAEEPSLDGP